MTRRMLYLIVVLVSLGYFIIPFLPYFQEVKHTGILVQQLVQQPTIPPNAKLFILTIGKLSPDGKRVIIESQIQGALAYETVKPTPTPTPQQDILQQINDRE